jgi:hypothetical protein
MQVEVPQEGTAEDHEQIRVAKDRPLGVLHTGNRYAFGFGPDFYGIWDSASSAPPTERFPPTDQGRQDGWKRYLELEPSGSGTVITALNPDEVWHREVEEKRRRGRRKSLLTMAVLVIVVGGGIVALAVTAGGGGAAAAKELSEAAKAKKAHVEITGDQTITEDLTQSDFVSTPLDSLIGASNKGVWKGNQVQLTIDLHNPEAGTFNTTEIGSRTLSMAITQADGSTLNVVSSRGECSITVDSILESGFSGSFKCTGVKLPGGAGAIDANGTFGASK